MKRNTKWTEEKIKKFQKEGRGIGEGKEYKPWITIRDFPSLGTVERIKGWKTDRIHHCLSQLEARTLFAFEWRDDVIDIREQYPLERSSTIKIADEIGVKHPYYPGSNIPTVMTTDFVTKIKTEQGTCLYAWSVKMSKELEKKRVLQKLEIEKRFWEMNNVSWFIITEREINKAFVKNMELIHSFYYLTEELNKQKDIFGDYLVDIVKKSSGTYLQAIEEFSSIYGIDVENSIAIFKHLVTRKIIKVDIMQEFILHSRIKKTSLTEV